MHDTTATLFSLALFPPPLCTCAGELFTLSILLPEPLSYGRIICGDE